MFESLLKGNLEYQKNFKAASAPSKPRRKVAILTCMDARLHPETFLGLSVGDAHVIRNAGGRASDDAIRSLVISEQLLGTEEIVVIHHTDCGMQTFTNETLRATLGAEAADIDFLPFSDLVSSVRDDAMTLRACPLIPATITITGAVYDVKNGKLSKIVEV